MADGNVDIIIAEDSAALARRAADIIVDLAIEAQASWRSITLALSGGSTPKALYQVLAGEEYANKIDWPLVHFFFGDERFVPSDDENSNYKLAWDNLLSKLPVPESNIHRVPVEAGAPTASSPEAAASEYELALRSYFDLQEGDLPRFDLVLLGLGDDGHTASLFPGKPALKEHDKLVVASPPGRLPPPVDRVTLTFPVLNNAAHVLFLVAGAGKAEVIKQILAPEEGVEPLPAQLIKPLEGKVTWLLDRAAAANLPEDATSNT